MDSPFRGPGDLNEQIRQDFECLPMPLDPLGPSPKASADGEKGKATLLVTL